MTSKPIKVVALTGGIGCGKSTVLKIFSKLGWVTLSADKICHEFYASKNAEFTAKLVERWGNIILNSDDTIDREIIANIVFNDKTELEWLNSILHPIIQEQISQAILSNKLAGRKFIMVEVPLLFEAGWESQFDTIICVWAYTDIQHSRLIMRGVPIVDSMRRIRSQAPLSEKMIKSDHAIANNDDNIIALTERCKQLDLLLRVKEKYKSELQEKCKCH